MPDPPIPPYLGWFRIDPNTGNRELVTVLPIGELNEPMAVWPEPSFFTPPAVAALSVGAAVLLGVALIGISKRIPNMHS